MLGKQRIRGNKGEEVVKSDMQMLGGGATTSYCRGEGGGRKFVIGDRENVCL